MNNNTFLRELFNDEDIMSLPAEAQVVALRIIVKMYMAEMNFLPLSTSVIQAFVGYQVSEEVIAEMMCSDYSPFEMVTGDCFYYPRLSKAQDISAKRKIAGKRGQKSLQNNRASIENLIEQSLNNQSLPEQNSEDKKKELVNKLNNNNKNNNIKNNNLPEQNLPNQSLPEQNGAVYNNNNIYINNNNNCPNLPEQSLPKQSLPRQKSVDHKKIIELWNTYANKYHLRKVAGLNANRTRLLTARIKEACVMAKQRDDKMFDATKIEFWDRLFKTVVKSDFLTNARGTNTNGWTATFDFCLTQNGFMGIIEGKYDNKTSSKWELVDDNSEQE